MAKGTDRRKREHRARDDRDRKAAKSVRALQRRLDELVDEQRALRKRVKRLGRRLEAGPPRSPFPPGPGGRGSWDGPGRDGLGPIVSVEVPLETDDPAAPLWATVAARLPEEIATVDDDGGVARYRYSAAGSTPQAPRYRRLADPPPPAGGPVPGG